MSTQTQASQKKNPNRIRLRADDRAMAILCYGIVGLFSFLCLVPFWYVLVYSFEPYSLYLTRPELPWPMEITLDAYKKALAYPLIWSGYRNTLFLATVGTMLTMTMMVVTAYPLTKRNLKGRNFILTLWVITMFFGGGMIPNYILVCRTLNLKNSLWALILPGLCGCYNLILMKNYMNGLPQSIEEAALIDGASPFTMLRKITLPLVRPTTVFVLMCTMANSFKMVDLIVTMTTKGGPNNSTNVLMYHIYQTAFAYWDIGKASVMTVVMLVFMLLVSFVQYGGMDRHTHYDN